MTDGLNPCCSKIHDETDMSDAGVIAMMLAYVSGICIIITNYLRIN